MMMPIADRLHMLEATDLKQLIAQAQNCESMWCEPLDPNSWREMLAAQLAATLNVPATGARPALESGSSANFHSRLFAGSLESWPNP